MKKKVVIKVTVIDQKSRTKVLKIAVGFSGVESVKFGAQEPSQIEVVGIGVDAVELATSLRKKVGYADIISVAAVGEDQNKEEKNDEDKPPQTMGWSYSYEGGVPAPYIYEANYSNYQDPCCSIM